MSRRRVQLTLKNLPTKKCADIAYSKILSAEEWQNQYSGDRDAVAGTSIFDVIVNGSSVTDVYGIVEEVVILTIIIIH